MSNGLFIDSNTADGMRKCFAEDFSDVYIFNLRGNQRVEDCQCPIAVTLFVKAGEVGSRSLHGIHYYEVGDYLTREEKLKALDDAVSFGEMLSAGVMRGIEPNEYEDWVNHRSGDYESFMNLGNKKEDRPAIFEARYSRGLVSGHDAYSFNFSREALRESMKTLKPEAFSDENVRVGLYRPYVKMMHHFSHETDIRVYQMPAIFPKPYTRNLVICAAGIGSKNFSVLMTDCLPSLTVVATCQCFPLFWYEDVRSDLFGTHSEQRDGVSGSMLADFRHEYEDAGITSEDVFCYVYGVLSSREYAERFGNDTRRVLARVPKVKGREKFREFVRAGRELGRLHVNYESAEMWPVRLEGRTENLSITKMRIIERGTRE